MAAAQEHRLIHDLDRTEKNRLSNPSGPGDGGHAAPELGNSATSTSNLRQRRVYESGCRESKSMEFEDAGARPLLPVAAQRFEPGAWQ